MEYSSEIWGDISKTNERKLDSLEHKALTNALGTNKLSKKSEVNLEAKVIPLALRRKRKLVKTYQRIIGTKLEGYLDISKGQNDKVTAKNLKEH